MPEKFTRGRADITRSKEGYKVDIISCSNCPQQKNACPLSVLKSQVEGLNPEKSHEVERIGLESIDFLQFEITEGPKKNVSYATGALCWRTGATEEEREERNKKVEYLKNLASIYGEDALLRFLVSRSPRISRTFIGKPVTE